MKKTFKLSLLFLTAFFLVMLASCFSEKKSVFYDSEWIMKNYDSQGLLYYHHLILQPGHRVMLRASYADSTNIIVWTGTYKINSRKFDFDFTECVRYENGEIVGQYKSGQLVKFYNGDFYYSVAGFDVEGTEPVEGTESAESAGDAKTGKSDSEGTASEEKNKKIYHLELIRPKNYFYGENKDIFGNLMEEFIKVK